MLGRETAIQKMRWTQDGWLELDADCVPEGRTTSFSNTPLEWVPAPACAADDTPEAYGGPDSAGPAGEAPFTGMILTLLLWLWIISPCAFPWTAIISP